MRAKPTKTRTTIAPGNQANKSCSTSGDDGRHLETYVECDSVTVPLEVLIGARIHDFYYLMCTRLNVRAAARLGEVLPGDAVGEHMVGVPSSSLTFPRALPREANIGQRRRRRRKERDTEQSALHKTNLPGLSFERTFHAVNLRSSRQPAFGFFLAIAFRLLLPPTSAAEHCRTRSALIDARSFCCLGYPRPLRRAEAIRCLWIPTSARLL